MGMLKNPLRRTAKANEMHKSLDAIRQRSSDRLGALAVRGRFHRMPKKLEDDYLVEDNKVLGSGYNGQVLLATSKDLVKPEKYAVKAFKLNGVSQEKKVELESECEIFLAMDHPNVVRLVDVYESADTLYLVMECMEGGELFKRVMEKKRFTEKCAADAAYQMLLAVHYLHGTGVVHRDLKLENFLFDRQDSDHLKLIDFGFSKIWEPNTKMALSCGTLAYVAPEVLEKSYTSQCDMWSLGVVVFIVIFGYMPFAGNEAKTVDQISKAKYLIKKEIWAGVSKQGRDFVKKLLVRDPLQRMDSQAALEHPWLADRANLHADAPVNPEVVQALTDFAQASAFRRASMNVMAWSLSSEEREKVEEAFLAIDTDKTGTISMSEFSALLQANFNLSDEDAAALVNESFDSLDQSHDHLIHYSEFLAAMVSSRIKLHDDLLKQAFRRFDVHNHGCITRSDLKEVMGDTVTAEGLEEMIKEADENEDGKISYDEFLHYFSCGSCKEHHSKAAVAVIDNAIAEGNHDKQKPLRMHSGIFHGHHSWQLPKKPHFQLRHSATASTSTSHTSHSTTSHGTSPEAGAEVEEGAVASKEPVAKAGKPQSRSQDFWWGMWVCCVVTVGVTTLAVVIVVFVATRED